MPRTRRRKPQRNLRDPPQSCSCGSGASRARCCAANVTLTDGRRLTAEALVEHAARAFQQGDPNTARQLLEAVRKVAPCQPQALHLAGLVALREHDLPGATHYFQQAIAHGLDDAKAQFDLATALGRQGQTAEATQALERAVTLEPNFPEAWHRLFYLRLAGDDPVGAATMTPRLTGRYALAGTDWQALAASLHHAREDDRAIASLHTALWVYPDDADLHASLAGILETLDRREEAEAAVAAALRLDAAQPMAVIVDARLRRRCGDIQGARRRLVGLHADKIPDAGTRIQFHREEIRIHEALDQHADAFRAARRMNDAIREDKPGKGAFEAMDRRLSAIEAGLPAWTEAIQAHPEPATDHRTSTRSPSAKRDPIFVLGFPRTGTTVLEMLLTQHPDVTGVGESMAIPEAETTLLQAGLSPADPGSGHPGQDTAQIIDQARRVARKRWQQDSGQCSGRPIFVDKHPMNAVYLTTIARLFPAATIVRMVRHPLDTVISCYFQPFTNNESWHTSIPETARFLARVDEHLRVAASHLPLKWIDVRMEDAIRAPDETLAAITDLHGLTAMPDRLRIQGETAYRTRTASYEQIRQPLSADFAERRSAYRAFVDAETHAPLRAMTTRWGYE